MNTLKLVSIVWIVIILASCGKTSNKKIESSVFFSDDAYLRVEVGDGQKMAYLDLNATAEKTVLLLHGEPNYSFAYRNIAPRLCEAGYRVVVPDLVGFGNSSKPERSDLITYSNHTKWLTEFINKLKLENIHLFAHDWGAMISLRIIAEKPQFFGKVAVSYGFLYDGTQELPESFLGFRNYAKSDSGFSAGNIMDWGSNVKLPDSVRARYDAPFRKPSDYYAARKFPSLIPDKANDKEGLINKRLMLRLKTFEKPFITIWGNHKDQLWLGKDSLLQEIVPGAKHQEHFTLESNHFVQEDQPEELSAILLEFFEKE